MGLLRSHNQTNNHKSEKDIPAKPVDLSEAKELLLLHSPESETAVAGKLSKSEFNPVRNSSGMHHKYRDE